MPSASDFAGVLYLRPLVWFTMDLLAGHCRQDRSMPGLLCICLAGQEKSRPPGSVYRSNDVI